MRKQEQKHVFSLWARHIFSLSRSIFSLSVVALLLLGGALTQTVQAQVFWPQLAAEIDHSFPAPQDSKPVGLAWDGAYFWVSDEANDLIYKINPSDGSLILSFPSPGPRPFGLAWDGQYLWHADAELDTIYKLDPGDGSVISSLPTPGQRDEVSCPVASLAWDGQHLWTPFYSRRGSFLYRIDPSDGSIIDSVSLSQTPAGLSGTFFCVPYDLAWDEGFLYLSAYAGCRIDDQEQPLPLDNYILRYEPASETFQVLVKTPPRLSGRFYLSSYPSGLTLDDNHRIWFTDKEYGLVCRITTFAVTQDHLTTDDFASGGDWLQFYPVINLTALSDQVAHIYYRINDGEASEGTVVSLEANGEFSVRYWGVDTEGRVEHPSNVIFVRIDVAPVDTTPPQVTYPETIHAQADDYDCPPGQDEPVQVAFITFENYMTVTDDMDDQVKLTFTPRNPYPVGTTLVQFTATDDGGNSVSGSITVTVEENPDMPDMPGYYASSSDITGYYGGSSDFVISIRPWPNIIFYSPWSPAVSSYPGYARNQGYGGMYSYGQLSSEISSYPEYTPAAGFGAYGGYDQESDVEASDPLSGRVAYWAYFPSAQNSASNMQSRSLSDAGNPLFSSNPSYSYLSPFFMDITSYLMGTTDTSISRNRPLLNPFSPFHDASPSYQFLKQLFPFYAPVLPWEYRWYSPTGD